MKKIFSLPLLSLFALFVSCRSADLSVRSEYYSREHLASVKMDTPDPKKESSAFGQRLIINWTVSESTFKEAPLELLLLVKLKNGEEKTTKIKLTRRQGQTFYPIFGNDYAKKGGLQSYRVELQSGGKTLTRSRHKLWVEKINTRPTTQQSTQQSMKSG